MYTVDTGGQIDNAWVKTFARRNNTAVTFTYLDDKIICVLSQQQKQVVKCVTQSSKRVCGEEGIAAG